MAKGLSRFPQQLIKRHFFGPRVESDLWNGFMSPQGEPNTTEFQVAFLDREKKLVSPWHHIPLIAHQKNSRTSFNFVNEIPKGTRPKMEVATKVPFNPIKQDIKKGKLREFTYGDIPFNYGCFPQTWENPHQPDVRTKLPGDNDPLDVVELSGVPLPIGAVIGVHVIGMMALIDEGETDWKILAISESSPLVASYLNIPPQDVVDEVRHWFENYKTTDGKGKNVFHAQGMVAQRPTLALIEEAHLMWGALLSGDYPAKDLWLPPNAKQFVESLHLQAEP